MKEIICPEVIWVEDGEDFLASASMNGNQHAHCVELQFSKTEKSQLSI